MATKSQHQSDENDAITTYSMHVSSRYLELTKQKLELTRLPRDLDLPEERQWEHGTPKAILEPLLDFWLDGYSWRTSESQFNLSLPQFRTTISTPSLTDPSHSHTLRIHFVHKKSPHPNAIPLLVCHSWPSSFIEVQRIVDALVDPYALPSMGEGAGLGFHVVAPSIPGFGFSDSSTALEFGVRETAGLFDGLMARLGYEGYVAHGVGWGFDVCRALALRYPERCRAVHTANPVFAQPCVRKSLGAWVKYTLARWTGGRLPVLSFGYMPSELAVQQDAETSKQAYSSLYVDRPFGSTLHRLYSLRPQTLSFSLCDSPVGLLAALLDVIHTRGPSSSSTAPGTRSPFLSPVQLDLEASAQNDEFGMPERVDSDMTIRPPPASPMDGELNARNYVWTPTEILNWTMMQWLPGPESSLRWLRQAHIDITNPQWDEYCPVPLGISTFYARDSNTATPLMWGSTRWDISWIKRHQRPATLPAWEAPDLLVLDLRECFGTLRLQGKLANLPLTAS